MRQTSIDPSGKRHEADRLSRRSAKIHAGYGGLTPGDPELVTEFGHASFVNKIAFSKDGKLLISGGQDQRARVWSVETGRELLKLEGHQASVSAVALTPDGKYAVTGGLDANLVLWNLATREPMRQFDADRAEITSVAVSPDGKLVAAGNGERAIVWDIATAKRVRAVKLLPRVNDVAFSPDGRRLAVVSGASVKVELATPARLAQIPKPQVALVNIDGRNEFWRYSKHTSPVNTVSFSADGAYVITGSGGFQGEDNSVRVLDAGTGTEIKILPHKASVDSVAMSPDKRTILTSGADQKVHVWDWESGKELRDIQIPVGHIFQTIYSPGGQYVAVATGSVIRLYDSENWKLQWIFGGALLDTNMVTSSPDDHFIVTANSFNNDAADTGKAISVNGAVCMWDKETGREDNRIDVKGFRLEGVCYSEDGRFLVMNQGLRVVMLDLNTRTEIRRFESDNDKLQLTTITAVALSHNGKLLLTGSSGLTEGDRNYATLWDAQTGKPIREIPHKSPVNSVAFSTDDHYLLTASGGEVFTQVGTLVEKEQESFLWDAQTGEQVKKFDGNRAVLSRNGKYLAVANKEVVTIWDLAYNRQLSKIDNKTGVESLSFSPDGQLILAGGSGGLAQLFETGVGRGVGAFNSQAGNIKSVSFTQDGKFVLTLGDDAITRVWSVVTGKELCDLLSLPNHSWIVIAPDGRFDTNNLEEVRGLHWGIVYSSLTVLPIEIFMRQYYEPRLLQRLLSGEKLRNVPSLSSLNRIQPEVKISSIARQPENPDRVSVVVSVSSQSGTAFRNEKFEQMNSGCYDLRLFRDGQLVGQYSDGKPQSVAQNAGEEGKLEAWRRENTVKLDATGKREVRFENIRLPRKADLKQVEFSAYAFNEDRVKSKTDRKPFDIPADLTSRKGRAYVITVGVNAYEDSSFDLKYSVNDAKLIQSNITDKLQKTGEYEEVVTVPLISDYKKEGQKRTVTEATATKKNVKGVLDLLAGRQVDSEVKKQIPNADKLQQARPEDLLLISFSSHGYADNSGNFYFVLYDTGPSTGEKVTEGLLEKLSLRFLSSEELSLWLRDVDAGEMLMIVDACHSAAAVAGGEFKPGPMGSRGLGQLSYDKGMRILTATQTTDVAYGIGALKQGLLTYVLVKEGLEEGKADFKPVDKEITASEWLEYGEGGVPKLLEEIGKKAKQADAPVDIRDLVQKTAPDLKTQRPSLFDFSRKRPEVLLVKQ